MPKINVLDKHLAEKIAAGEVVERPASVVKELVENAIDAGAAKITVEIERGGILLMRITDDGCGIAREDVRTAFLRHATSKIQGQEDLDAIATLGFRGEALASICAVAKVQMLTRTAEEEAGTEYLIQGGEEVSLSDAGCPVGTTLVVRELFYNTPARMKFLKTDKGEGNAVAAVLDKIALSHPEVSFQMIRDGKTILQTPGDNRLQSAIYTVLGREFASKLLPLHHEWNGVEVMGYISQPSACRPNRNAQHFFINGRYIKSSVLVAAVEQAYRNASMVGKFPGAVLHLSIPYGTVDVNVHPAKMEVRFSDEKRIFDAVYYGTKNALAGQQTRPAVQFSHKPSAPPEKSAPQGVIREFWTSLSSDGFAEQRQQAAGSASSWNDSIVTFKDPLAPVTPDILTLSSSGSMYNQKEKTVDLDIMVDAEEDPPVASSPAAAVDRPLVADISLSADLIESADSTQLAASTGAADVTVSADSLEPTLPSSSEVRSEIPKAVQPDFAASESAVSAAEGAAVFVSAPPKTWRILGEAFSTYILVEQGDTLVIIDKHAVHERMLFEELQRAVTPKQQLLLLPVTVPLSKEEYGAILENLDAMEQAGYAVEDFGSGSLLVRGVPVSLAGEDVPSLLMEAAAGFLAHKREAENAKAIWLLESVACRAAVKAGDKLSEAELEVLVRRVLEDQDIFTCPHGRPVAIRMTEKELEKQFGRIQS